MAAEGSVTAATAPSKVEEEVMISPVDESTEEKLEGSNGEAIVPKEPPGCVRRSSLRDAALKALWPRANDARVCMVLWMMTSWLVWIPMHRDGWSIWDEVWTKSILF